jgi:predicted lipid-binding transport protein (Tim44 family)
MTKKHWKMLILSAAFIYLFFGVLELDAFARAGGGRSFGSRGSRPSAPSRSYSSPSPAQPAPGPQQPGSQPGAGFNSPRPFGGFLGGFGGMLVGGLLGSLLFRGLGIGGPGGMGGGMGGGIGFFEILIFALLAYGIYRFIKARRERAAYSAQTYYTSGTPSYQEDTSYVPPSSPQVSQNSDVNRGLSYIRQMDPSFNEDKFRENITDLFFKIQAGWANRDLSPVSNLLTPESYSSLKEMIDDLKGQKRVNHLENIAMRKVELLEVWQETGNDFITVKFLANLLDYTVEEATGQVVSGSKFDPVKFEEYWTFTRPVGNNPWKLSAIQQVE